LSQQLFICKGYTTEGDPIDPILNKKIQAGQSATILLTFKKNEITDNIIFLYIDKITANDSENYFSQLTRVGKNKNWIAYNFKFENEGKYEIYYTDFNRRKLISASLIVEASLAGTDYKNSEKDIYPNAQVFFCERILNHKPNGVYGSIPFRNTNGEVYVYIINKNAFGFDIITVKVWRRKTTNSNYEEYIDSKKFEIKPNWKDTYFKYQFSKTGEYMFSFFNEKEILIKTAYITVTN
jgi:hypothetical protein